MNLNARRPWRVEVLDDGNYYATILDNRPIVSYIACRISGVPPSGSWSSLTAVR
jgi:hypothetical protein